MPAIVNRNVVALVLLLLWPTGASAWSTPDEALGQLGRDFASLARCTAAAGEAGLTAGCVELARGIDAKLHRLQREHPRDRRVSRLAVGDAVGRVDPGLIAAVFAEAFACDEATSLNVDCALRVLDEMLGTVPRHTYGYAELAILDAYVYRVSALAAIGEFSKAARYIRELAERSPGSRALIDAENALLCGLARAGHGSEAELGLRRLQRAHRTRSILPGLVCVHGATEALLAANTDLDACGDTEDCHRSFAYDLRTIAAAVTRVTDLPTGLLAAMAQPFLDRDRRDDSDQERTDRSRVVELHAATARALAASDAERAGATLDAGMAVALGAGGPSVWSAIGAAAVENRRSFIRYADPHDKANAAVRDLVALAEAARAVDGFAERGRAWLALANQAAGEQADALAVMAAAAGGVSGDAAAREYFDRAAALTLEDDAANHLRLCPGYRYVYEGSCGAPAERPTCSRTPDAAAETLFHFRSGDVSAAHAAIRCPAEAATVSDVQDDAFWPTSALSLWERRWNRRDASDTDRRSARVLEELLQEGIGHDASGALLAIVLDQVKAIQNHDVRIGLLIALSQRQIEAGHTFAAAQTMGTAIPLIAEQHRTGFAASGHVHYDDEEQIAFAIRNQAAVVRVLALRHRPLDARVR